MFAAMSFLCCTLPQYSTTIGIKSLIKQEKFPTDSPPNPPPHPKQNKRITTHHSSHHDSKLIEKEEPYLIVGFRCFGWLVF